MTKEELINITKDYLSKKDRFKMKSNLPENLATNYADPCGYGLEFRAIDQVGYGIARREYLNAERRYRDAITAYVDEKEGEKQNETTT
jgi:hypothetical protein